MTQINERTRRRDKDAVTYAIAQEATNSIAQTLANLKQPQRLDPGRRR